MKPLPPLTDYSRLNSKPSSDTAQVVLARLRLAQGLLNTCADAKRVLYVNPAYQKAQFALNALVLQAKEELNPKENKV